MDDTARLKIVESVLSTGMKNRIADAVMLFERGMKVPNLASAARKRKLYRIKEMMMKSKELESMLEKRHNESEPKKKQYEPPKMKIVAIPSDSGQLLCGSNSYWNNCEQPSENEWWGNSK